MDSLHDKIIMIIGCSIGFILFMYGNLVIIITKDTPFIKKYSSDITLISKNPNINKSSLFGIFVLGCSGIRVAESVIVVIVITTKIKKQKQQRKTKKKKKSDKILLISLF